jgi:hypothetical protein
MLEAIGLALGGRAGARLAAAVGVVAGRATLLRLVRALPEPVLIAAAVILGVALAGVAAFVTYRLRQGRATGAVRLAPPRPVPWPGTEPLSGPSRPAVEAPREVHLHFHGADAEEIAAALRQLPD